MTAHAPWLAGLADAWLPPDSLTLSQWADRYFQLSPESAAEPGPWRTIAYQRGIMDAITDPAVTFVTVMKSARIGWTKIMDAAIGYYMHQDPCPIMVVQPTGDDARGYSKEEIAPMLRDVPVLRDLVREQKTRRTESTILLKHFAGGVLDIIGSNSGAGFRRKSRRVVIFDEVDGLAVSAGGEGDPLKLGINRTKTYANRKILAGSTPLVAGVSRIAEEFEKGDQRRYFVPCPQCGHMDVLTFHEQPEHGHFMKWPPKDPGAAYFVCRGAGCVIEERDKRAMIDAGEWRAAAPFKGHASFHIWAGYSMSPNSAWGDLAREFVESKQGGPEKLKTFVNTVLGETWHERGEAPDWERIYLRREKYPIGSVPDGAVFITAGVDVQKDRFVFEVVAWAPNKESWSVDSGVLPGDTANDRTWTQLDELLGREFTGAGRNFSIAMLAVDSGYNTQQVYNWARRHSMSRVRAIKGMRNVGKGILIGAPSPVDVLQSGRRQQRGYRVWPVGVSMAKTELYGWLRLPVLDDGARPGGYCHFPEYGEEYFRQLTAEHMVTTARRNGGTSQEWQIIPGRENHFLDCRIYARAAASMKRLDVHVADQPLAPVPLPPAPPPPAGLIPARPSPPAARPGAWLGGRGGGWFRGRR